MYVCLGGPTYLIVGYQDSCVHQWIASKLGTTLVRNLTVILTYTKLMIVSLTTQYDTPGLLQ